MLYPAGIRFRFCLHQLRNYYEVMNCLVVPNFLAMLQRGSSYITSFYCFSIIYVIMFSAIVLYFCFHFTAAVRHSCDMLVRATASSVFTANMMISVITCKFIWFFKVLDVMVGIYNPAWCSVLRWLDTACFDSRPDSECFVAREFVASAFNSIIIDLPFATLCREPLDKGNLHITTPCLERLLRRRVSFCGDLFEV